MNFYTLIIQKKKCDNLAYISNFNDKIILIYMNSENQQMQNRILLFIFECLKSEGI